MENFPSYVDHLNRLKNESCIWLITGVAGFIGSNLLETLLKLDQLVIGLDNFSTGYQTNLDEVKLVVSEEQWRNFKFIEGDICDLNVCKIATAGVDYVLHQAALGSVPRSIDDPIGTNNVNVSGFLNILVASKDAGVKSFVYAASSSTYGDHPDLPKIEYKIGNPLSPYAVTKYLNELYAEVFSKCYGFKSIGLRYFNVFGPRQNVNGSYAAVIPKWISSFLKGDQVYINGDGESSRDFTFVDNVVQANILAAVSKDSAKNQIYNIAIGERTTLNQLFSQIQHYFQGYVEIEPVYQNFRQADVRHSLADISKAKNFLGYEPTHTVEEGIRLTCARHIKNRAN